MSNQDPTHDDKLVAILEKLAEAGQASGLNAAQLETLLQRVGLTSAEAMRLSLRPENPTPTNISAFFTEADRRAYGSFDNKPTLRRKTYFIGIEEKDERLTPSEIEGYNKIAKTCEARNGRWKAQVKVDGTEESLWVTVPCDSLDDRMDLRPLTLILHELNGGQSTENLGGLLRQLEQLQGLAQSHGATAAELETIMLGE